MMRDPVSEKRVKALNRAATLLNQGDLPRAAAALEAVLAEAPDDDRVLVKLAEVRRRQGRMADAVETYLRAGTQHAQRGFVLKSVALLKQAYLLQPADARLLEPLAEHSLQMDQPREALRYLVELADLSERAGDAARLQAALRRAIDLAPETAAYLLRLATHLAATGQAEQAADLLAGAAARFEATGLTEAWLSTAEQLTHHRAPDRAGRLRLARAHLAAGRPKQALRHLQALLALDPRDGEAIELLVGAFEALGLTEKVEAARRGLEAVRGEAGQAPPGIADPPALPPALPPPLPPTAPEEEPFVEHLRKATILVKYQEPERALGHLALAIEAAPRRPEPYLLRRDLLVRLGRPVEAAGDAVRAIDALLRACRGDEAAAAVEALRRIEFGTAPPAAVRSATATAAVEPPVDRTDDLSRLLAALEDDGGAVLALEEDPAYAVEEVLAQFRAGVALTVRPEDAATHHDLGIAFFEMELFRQAQEEFETACDADPARQGECLVMIGRCRLGLGEAAEAIAALERAIALPDLVPEARASGYAALASALELDGRPRAALLHLLEARRLAPAMVGLGERITRLEAADRAAAVQPGAPLRPWDAAELTPSLA